MEILSANRIPCPTANEITWDGKMWIGTCESIVSRRHSQSISARFTKREGAESFVACGVDTSKYRPSECSLPSLLPGVGSSLSFFRGDILAFPAEAYTTDASIEARADKYPLIVTPACTDRRCQCKKKLVERGLGQGTGVADTISLASKSGIVSANLTLASLRDLNRSRIFKEREEFIEFWDELPHNRTEEAGPKTTHLTAEMEAFINKHYDIVKVVARQYRRESYWDEAVLLATDALIEQSRQYAELARSETPEGLRKKLYRRIKDRLRTKLDQRNDRQAKRVAADDMFTHGATVLRRRNVGREALY